MIVVFCVAVILLLIWLCLLVRTKNQNLVYIYDELVDIEKSIEEKLDGKVL